MKALVLAAVLAASTSIAPAGAARDVHPQAVVDNATAALIADASRLGSASLTSLNGNSNPWTPASRQSEVDFDTLTGQVDTGTWLITIGLLAVALAGPISRLLRRHEQHRRAAALASTLGHTPNA